MSPTLDTSTLNFAYLSPLLSLMICFPRSPLKKYNAMFLSYILSSFVQCLPSLKSQIEDASLYFKILVLVPAYHRLELEPEDTDSGYLKQ